MQISAIRPGDVMQPTVTTVSALTAHFFVEHFSGTENPPV